MKASAIYTPGAPEPIGPYSQAVRAGGFIFTSGQIAIDPETGYLKDGGIREQTLCVLNNLKAVLQAGNSDFSDVVEVLLFLTDLKDFTEVNSLYEQAMEGHKPVRTTVQVSALPRGAKIEIRMIAYKDK